MRLFTDGKNEMPFEFPRVAFVRTGVSGISLANLLRLVLSGIFLSVGGLQFVSAQSIDVAIHSKSQFWIQGKATTHNFTCDVNRVDGQATLPAAQDSIPDESDQKKTEVVVRVPVQAFDCGNRRMTRDLKETLKMEEHSEIRFELVHATVGAPVDTSGTWRTVNVLGALTVAGTKRLVRIEALGHALDAYRFRVRGCKPIRMTYFNIEPPTKAFGLIKVKNEIVVQFDLLAHAPEKTSESPFESVSIDQSPACPAVSPASP